MNYTYLPTRSALLILVIYAVLHINNITQNGHIFAAKPICYRMCESWFTWNIYIPSQFCLLAFALYEFIVMFRKQEVNIGSVLAVLPVVIHFITVFVK